MKKISKKELRLIKGGAEGNPYYCFNPPAKCEYKDGELVGAYPAYCLKYCAQI